MRVRHEGEKTSIGKIRAASLHYIIEKAATTDHEPRGWIAYDTQRLNRALDSVLGIRITNAELNRLIRGAGVTQAFVRKSPNIRWVKIGRQAYYSLEDVRRLLAQRPKRPPPTLL